MILNQLGQYRLIAGTVTDVQKGMCAIDGTRILFLNSKTPGISNKLADRLFNARVCVGEFLGVLATYQDGKMYAVEFLRQGLLTLVSNDKAIPLVIGAFGNIRFPKAGMTCFSIPIPQKSGQTKWVDVTSFDVTTDGRITKNAEKIREIIENSKYIAVTGGAIRTKVVNGANCYDLIARKFTGSKPERKLYGN